MTHSELRELLPAYALDALGPIDRLEVRAHLEVCATCEEILREQQGTAANLGFGVDPEMPTRRLRDRLTREVAETAQVLPIGVRKEWRKLPRLGAPVAAAMVLVLGTLAGAVVGRFGNQDRFIPEVVSLLSSPNVNAIQMTATGEDTDAAGRVYLPTDAHAAAVIMTGLDDPGNDVYQLAIVLDGQTIPVHNFQPDSRGVAVVLIRKNLEAMEGVIVTREPSPGLKVPTGKLILKSG